MKTILTTLILFVALNLPAQFTRVLPSQEPPTNSLLPGDLIIVAKAPGTANEKIYKMTYLDFFNWLVTSGLVNTGYLGTVTGTTNGMNAHISTVENAASALAIRAGNLEGMSNNVTGIVKDPLTTNGPLAPAHVFVGDSMTANGYWDNGYPIVASGIGCDYPGRMLQQSNFVYHGPYFNLGSNTSTIYQWVSNGFVLNSTLTNTLGDLKAHHIPSVATVLLGANDITDINFQSLTNAYGSLYATIKSYGSWLQVITPITNANYNAGYNTTRTNLAAWIKSMTNGVVDEAFDSDAVFTNSSQFISDNTHPNCTGNLNLGVYINAHTRLTNYFRTLGLGNTPLHATTLDVDFIRTRGIQVNDFLSAGPGATPGWNGTFAFIYGLDTANNPTTFRVSGQPLQLTSTSGGVQVLNNGIQFGGTGASIIFDGTNSPTYAQMAGSLYINTNVGALFIRTNGTWLMK